MDMKDILRKARAEMNKHGLTSWNLEAGSSLTAAGICYDDHRRIVLSRKLLPYWPDAEVQDTILHEIAHALTPDDPGHGAEWKKMCVRLGANPVAVYSEELSALAPKKWTMTCECGFFDGKQAHRRVAVNKCATCSTDVLYYLTGSDKASAAPYKPVSATRKVAELVNEHDIRYHNGMWVAPDGYMFKATGTTYLDTHTETYYTRSGMFSYRMLCEDLVLGLSKIT